MIRSATKTRQLGGVRLCRRGWCGQKCEPIGNCGPAAVTSYDAAPALREVFVFFFNFWFLIYLLQVIIKLNCANVLLMLFTD